MTTWPTINNAKSLGKQHGLRGVIILSFSNEQQSGASWGKDRKHCKRFGELMDDIMCAIRDETFGTFDVFE